MPPPPAWEAAPPSQEVAAPPPVWEATRPHELGPLIRPPPGLDLPPGAHGRRLLRQDEPLLPHGPPPPPPGLLLGSSTSGPTQLPPGLLQPLIGAEAFAGPAAPHFPQPVRLAALTVVPGGESLGRAPPGALLATPAPGALAPPTTTLATSPPPFGSLVSAGSGGGLPRRGAPPPPRPLALEEAGERRTPAAPRPLELLDTIGSIGNSGAGRLPPNGASDIFVGSGETTHRGGLAADSASEALRRPQPLGPPTVAASMRGAAVSMAPDRAAPLPHLLGRVGPPPGLPPPRCGLAVGKASALDACGVGASFPMASKESSRPWLPHAPGLSEVATHSSRRQC